jgi:hypothetical protein
VVVLSNHASVSPHPTQSDESPGIVPTGLSVEVWAE